MINELTCEWNSSKDSFGVAFTLDVLPNICMVSNYTYAGIEIGGLRGLVSTS